MPSQAVTLAVPLDPQLLQLWLQHPYLIPGSFCTCSLLPQENGSSQNKPSLPCLDKESLY